MLYWCKRARIDNLDKKGSMMIIENSRTDDIKFAKDEVATYRNNVFYHEEIRGLSPEVTQPCREQLALAEAKLAAFQREEIPRYVSKEALTTYQMHAVTGTTWQPPERGQQTYPQGFLVMQSIIVTLGAGGFGIHLLVDGQIGYGLVSLLGALAFMVIGVTTDYPSTLAPLHNRRIRQTPTDDIKTYILDKPVTGRLRSTLDDPEWTRLIDGLGKDNLELGKAFVNYYEDTADVIESIRALRASTVEPALSKTLIGQLNKRADEVSEDAAATIRDIFARRDTIILEAEARALEELQAAEITRSIEASFDEDIHNRTIIANAASVLASQRR